MDHTLTVGEIYDRAIDLCLRNARIIALALGPIVLVENTFFVLGSGSVNNKYLAAWHLQLQLPVLNNGWLVVLGYLFYFIAFPIAGAALCVLFDHALRGESVGLRESFSSPPRSKANVILTSILFSIGTIVPAFAMLTAIVAAVVEAKASDVILLLIFVIVGLLLIGLVATLTIGTALGFVRTALDAGRVIESIRFGIASSFSKHNRWRVLSVGLPLLFLFGLGEIGSSFAGIAAFGLSGAIVANVVVRSIGNVMAWSLLAAVATVYYRNLATAA